MGKKFSLVIIGMLILVTPFVISQVLRPQHLDEHAAEISVTPSVPVAATLGSGCHYQEVCPSCPASKECVCHPVLVCARITVPPVRNNQ